MDGDFPPFPLEKSRVAIVGVGLMGGSLALALRSRELSRPWGGRCGSRSRRARRPAPQTPHGARDEHAQRPPGTRGRHPGPQLRRPLTSTVSRSQWSSSRLG